MVVMGNDLDNLKIGLMITSFKGDIRQPHNYAMSRVPARFSRWSVASSYYYEIERILKELDTAVSFVKIPPDETFLTTHSMTREDYIMYHQGYFLDLVHQLKDKLCHMVKAIVSFEDDFKDNKKLKLSKLLTDGVVVKIPHLLEHLKHWDAYGNSGSVIATVLNKRTLYHHYRNPLPAIESYMQAKTHSFLLSPAFQSQLSEVGKIMIAERSDKNYSAWQTETLEKMSTTLEALKVSLGNISKSLTEYFKFPTNDKAGGLIMTHYINLDGLTEVKDSEYTRSSIHKDFSAIAKMLDTSLNFALQDNLVSVYLTGSILRSDFIFGLSNINIVVVLKTDDLGIKKITTDFINSPPASFGIPMDTQVLSEAEFLSNEKLRFICKADGLLLCGQDLLRNDKKQKMCFKLAWILNKDFKEHLLKAKELVEDPNTILTEKDVSSITRDIAKRAFWLSFSQVVGNNTKLTFSPKEMLRLNNYFYPQNRPMNSRNYLLITRHVRANIEGLRAVIDSYERNFIPLYDAMDHVVNGKPS